MGPGRKEFVSFSDANADSDTDTNTNPDTNLVGDGQTNQPFNKHHVQPWHESDSYRLGIKRCCDAA
jgi:hypothetical protein